MSKNLDDYLRILNETGFFFQMRVAKEVDDVFDIVKEEIPFEHNRQTSKLDALAEISNDHFRAFIFIEAKRHSHDFNSWIFFRPERTRKPPPPYILAFGVFKPSEIVDGFYASSVSNKSGAALNLALVPYQFSKLGSLEVGYIGIEVKLSESKHRLQDLTEVSKDVVIATHGMAMEIEKRAPKDKRIREEVHFFIPVIVTTAKLFLAGADLSKVALSDGKISQDGLNLQEVPWLVYEFPLTAELLLPVNAGSERWDSVREDDLRKRHIFVVNSENLREFLVRLKSNLKISGSNHMEARAAFVGPP